ncbi:MAG TPA: hypothetical protein DEF43_12110 [Chloroflexus aurantiacus]|uniref:Uncharacterized protein n=1 Tax=Chloroflexus aurantiacus (strain ATCC 29366 / DSM 635 / J-10-fl) TaxID=324602 RepID=A9WIA5_CHLAA|nr:hypothetical protein Caur_3203 [Chloroflexus aurantiacus J-10-fl]RMG48568.1 MAG: hypothetical protein D6716_12960 [Chloroflexota bacterium]HBW67880.1 hypothetical protein [Chloroflexus aurantiacus]
MVKGTDIRSHLAAVQECWVIWLTDGARRGIAVTLPVTGTTHSLVIIRLVGIGGRHMRRPYLGWTGYSSRPVMRVSRGVRNPLFH